MKIQLPAGDFEAYIFDCDGTLADTMPLHYQAWLAALKEYACEFPEAFFYELGGVPTDKIVEILNERHGCSMPVKETATCKDELFIQMIPQTLPIEPVVELVHQFHGVKPLAVASGGTRDIVTRTLEALGILRKFQTVVTVEDYRRGKPAPDPFIEAARQLGVVPQNCLVFEDTSAGIAAAKAANMQWVLVETAPTQTVNDEQIQQLLQDLVRIPSVSPHGDPGTAQKNTGEARIAEYIAEVLRKLALDVELREVEPGRPNVIGKFTSRGARRSVAFAPHTDTVSVAGMTIDPFAAEIRDGKLYGRGACDTKGSLAAMLAALANVVRRKEFREGDLDVYFCALMGEESGNHGAKALAESGFKVDFAVVGEPTDGRIVYTHKGALSCKVITRGRSVHGSLPEKGVSAIGKMAEVVQYLLGDYARALAKAADPALGAPTVNVGTIRGGTQNNIVPDYCEIEVDRRTVPGEAHEEILTTLRQKFRQFPITTEILSDCPPLRTDPQNSFVQKLAEATGNPKNALVGAPWFCDAGILAQHGVPAVAFGPGSITQAHTADEYVEWKEVLHATQTIERFLLSVATGA